MSIGCPHHSRKSVGLLVGPRSRKLSALVFALILSAGAFVLASREAQAGQGQADDQPLVVKQYKTPETDSKLPATLVSAPHPIEVSAAATGFAATDLTALTDSSSVSGKPSFAGSKVPSGNNLRLSSHTGPPDNAFFGLTSGGAQSRTGSICASLLLLGVLVPSLLLRRQERFLLTVSWELPKPDSALLMPLERPG